jgi:hypothetical protein
MPDCAEIVARTPGYVGHPQNPAVLTLEYGHTRVQSRGRAISHVLRKRVSRVTHHGKHPAAARGKLLLDNGRVRSRNHERRPGMRLLDGPGSQPKRCSSEVAKLSHHCVPETGTTANVSRSTKKPP